MIASKMFILEGPRTPNCDYKAVVRLLNAGTPWVCFLVRCSLPTPRCLSIRRLVRLFQAEKISNS
jgi:hypothetical protein